MEYREITNLVNKVLFNVMEREFTFDELNAQLQNYLPEESTESDRFYATEILKGTLCRLRLDNSVKMIDEEHYTFRVN